MISSDSIWGWGEITAGIGILRNIVRTYWHHIDFSCRMAAKCLVAMLFKRIGHIHIIVNMR